MIFNRQGGQGIGVPDGPDSGQDIRITRSVWLPMSAVKFRFARSSGPGGQNVNKVATKVEALCDPGRLRGLTADLRSQLLAAVARRLDREGRIRIVEDRSRSQWANRERALSRTVDLLRRALAARKTRTTTTPTRASRERRVSAKIRRGNVKRLRGAVSRDD
jgi:ribosome-associated protein